MTKNDTSFKPGKSGNPKGRPPKKRTLTNLLEKGGNQKFAAEGKPQAAKQLFVQKVWEGLATGHITYQEANGQAMRFPLDAQQYIALARLVLGQIDGPPKAEIDVTSEGKAIAASPTMDSMKELFQDFHKQEKDADADH